MLRISPGGLSGRSCARWAPSGKSSSPPPHLLLTSSSPHPHLILTSSSPHPHLLLTSSSPHPHLILSQAGGVGRDRGGIRLASIGAGGCDVPTRSCPRRELLGVAHARDSKRRAALDGSAQGLRVAPREFAPLEPDGCRHTSNPNVPLMDYNITPIDP